MVVELKDQQLKMVGNTLVEPPACGNPKCEKPDRMPKVYHELRKQFWCGRCYYDDIKKIEAAQRVELEKFIQRIDAQDQPKQ